MSCLSLFPVCRVSCVGHRVDDLTGPIHGGRPTPLLSSFYNRPCEEFNGRVAGEVGVPAATVEFLPWRIYSTRFILYEY
jgi:hypothetical protein